MRSLAKALARGLILAAIVALALPAVADRAGVKVKGTISAIDLIGSTVTVTPARGGADVTVTVDASTRITRNRRAAGLADLLVGDSVEVKYNPTTLVASKIEVKSPGSGSTPTAEVKGTVTAVDPLLGTLTVTSTLTSGSVTVQVDATTKIERDDAPATLADIQVGDCVEVKYNPTTSVAIKIEAKSATLPPPGPGLAEVEGTISGLDLGLNSVTITPKSGGAPVTLLVDSTTSITRNEMAATLSDLQVGDKCEAKYDPVTGVALKIKAKSATPPSPAPGLAKVEGTISGVDLGLNSVTITPKRGGAPVTLLVDSTTSIKRNGRQATLADLQVGDKAEAKYVSTTLIAVKIEAKRR
ncbi:MAG: hypothetical protein D6691_05020 [Candidatus Hydrogenedentota bacterium]|uniref:DUF5666 domain-containing protein n=1 Tax=Sumerlaea chitinivorans TaxID=2250252 RepID=A0A2Z4Y858_SUMC1|nr:hypothetical protein BRCON_1846 [Candidatus Sumerlaea chitinivorans]RMH28230.1 MAG: hypothetical protein D6691_05020 [Candidatus Hydrogenedentota bacterium]